MYIYTNTTTYIYTYIYIHIYIYIYVGSFKGPSRLKKLPPALHLMVVSSSHVALPPRTMLFANTWKIFFANAQKMVRRWENMEVGE